MAKIIKGKDGTVTLRLDNVYVSSGKHLVKPYITEDDKKRYFGNFKFRDLETAKKILKQAVKESDYEDTVFYGPYPNWIEDEYGESLQCQNRVKFYKHIKSSELVDDDDINEYIYSLEVHLKKSKEGGIFLVVARAIATGENVRSFNDDLFEDFIGDEEMDNDSEDTTDFEKTSIDISEDDLPF